MQVRNEAEIRARVEAFAESLLALIEQTAIEAIRGSLPETRERSGGTRTQAREERRFSERPDDETSAARKRDPAAIAGIAERLAAFVASQPGSPIAEISRGLGIATKELALPMRKLVAEGAVTSRGQRRATRYYPGKAPRASAARRKSGTAPTDMPASSLPSRSGEPTNAEQAPTEAPPASEATPAAVE